MSFTDLQSVGQTGAHDGHNMFDRLALWIPDISLQSAIAWMTGIIGAGWAMPALFGAAAENAPTLALATTIAGGLLLVWRTYVERDARHMREQVRELRRDNESYKRKLGRAGIDLERTDD